MKKFNKSLLILLIAPYLAFADYSIYFNKIKLGSINNFSSLDKNFIKIKITNKIAKFFLRKEFVIYYNEKYNLTKKNKNTLFKKDKYQIVNILKSSIQNENKSKRLILKKTSYLDIEYNKNYNFTYVSKGKTKSKGSIIVKNKELISLRDTMNNVSIKNNN